jgi:hypothetical protein
MTHRHAKTPADAQFENDDKNKRLGARDQRCSSAGDHKAWRAATSSPPITKLTTILARYGCKWARNELARRLGGRAGDRPLVRAWANPKKWLSGETGFLHFEITFDEHAYK